MTNDATGLHRFATTAERCYRTGDLTRAEKLFAELEATDPHDSRTPAFLARIRTWRGTLPSAAAAGEALKVFREAVKLDPNFALGFQFIGEALKIRGELREAERAFRAALQIDPSLIDSAREVRLFEMRNRGTKHPTRR